MIYNKNKIMKAVSEGIKTGFRISSNNIIDDSSFINFENSKINKVESLSLEKIFGDYIKSNDLDNAYEVFEKYKNVLLNNLRNKKYISFYLAFKNLGKPFIKKIYIKTITLNYIFL